MAASNNRIDLYAAQSESPLFKPPRELGDEIYEYCSLEENDYFHGIATGKLFLANREPTDLHLMYTCRAVARKMKGVSLHANTVTFEPGDIRNDHGFHGFRSRAGRPGKVIEGVVRTRRRMLHYVTECITPEMLDSTIAKFGDGGRRLMERFRAAGDWPRTPRHWDVLDLTDGWHVNSSVDESTEYHNALRYLLKPTCLGSRHLPRELIAASGTAYVSMSSMRPLGWNGVKAAGPHNTLTTPSYAPLYALINWIYAEMDSRSQLPEKSFTLIFKDFAPDAWEVVKEAVLLQAVITTSYQRLHLDPPQRFSIVSTS